MSGNSGCSEIPRNAAINVGTIHHIDAPEIFCRIWHCTGIVICHASIKRRSAIGFKCPICSKDFGTSRYLFQLHVDNDHNGTAVRNIAETVGDPLSDLINGHTEPGIPVVFNGREPVVIGTMPVPDAYEIDERVVLYVDTLLRTRSLPCGKAIEISKILTRDQSRVAFVVHRADGAVWTGR